MSTTNNADATAILLQLEKEWKEMDSKSLEQFLLQSVDILDAKQFATVMLYGFNDLHLSRTQLSKLLGIAQTLRINAKLSNKIQAESSTAANTNNSTKAILIATHININGEAEYKSINSTTFQDLCSLVIYRIFSFLSLTQLLSIELCCKSFRIHAHHPLSFNNTQCLNLFPSHFPSNLYRFKHCTIIALHLMDDMNGAQHKKKINPLLEYRSKQKNKEWRSIFTEINTHFTNIQRIEIPVNFPAFKELTEEMLMKIERIQQLVIDGNTKQNNNKITNVLDDEFAPFSVFNDSFDLLVSELLSSEQLEINELHINNTLLQLQSLSMKSMTLKHKHGKNIADKLILSKCHVESQGNTSSKHGLLIKNVLIRNDTPYSSKCASFHINHPLVLPLTHCVALMLNWTVLKNEYELEKEIALSNLSKLHEFAVKFHACSAMELFTAYVLKMKIGNQLQSLFLCINDYFNTFENDIHQSVKIMNLFLNVLFDKKHYENDEKKKEKVDDDSKQKEAEQTNIDQLRLEFRRASWELVDVAVSNIIRKYTDTIDKFEFFYYEPKYKKYKHRKQRKLLSQRERRLNAMTNIFNGICEKLKGASYVYIKISYTEEFDEAQMNEFEKDFHCITEEIDDDEYIYEFLLRHKDKEKKSDTNDIKPTYTFDIYDFETYDES